MHVDSAQSSLCPGTGSRPNLQAKIIEADPKAAEEQPEVVLLMAPGG
jgi:hypothetical protein